MWEATGTPKPTDHPAWPAFQNWVRLWNQSRAALADHPVWWECFLAGAAAEKVLVDEKKSKPVRFALEDASDYDLLQAAVEADDPKSRADARAVLKERIAASKLRADVALLFGGLLQLKEDASLESRRAKVVQFREIYGLLAFKLWPPL